MFARIEYLSDLLPHIEGNSQIRVKRCESTGHTTVCYMLQDEDTFAEENESYRFARECRGITFDESDKISARTLHKFFNVGERESTQPDLIDWPSVVRIMEKRDGSMITPVLMKDGKLKCKTKKSFTTKEAALADEVIRANPIGYLWIKELIVAGLTPTFEITSPKLPIVICYTKDELTLLHIRENVDGRYLTEDELHSLESPFPVVQNLTDKFMWKMGGEGLPYTECVDWVKLKEAAETATGIEGWVIQFENGDMLKLKTKWYCELHHAVTFTRWRDVARVVCEDKSDDLKGAFTLTGRSVEPILEVERKIKGRLIEIESTVRTHATLGLVNEKTAKDMALQHKDHEYFGLIMRAFRKQEINYLEYYMNKYLELEWGLEVIPLAEEVDAGT